MIQCRNSVRLALKSRAQIGVARHAGRQHFDRDGAIEPHVARAVDLAHVARTEGGEDFVRTEVNPAVSAIGGSGMGSGSSLLHRRPPTAKPALVQGDRAAKQSTHEGHPPADRHH